MCRGGAHLLPLFPFVSGGVSVVKSVPLLPSAVGDFESRHICGNTYLLSLRGASPFLTGLMAEKHLSLPISVRLLRIEFVHVSLVDTVSTDAWSINVWRQVALSSGMGMFWMFSSPELSDRDCVVSFSREDGILPPSLLKLHCQNATATDRIYPFIYVEVL